MDRVSVAPTRPGRVARGATTRGPVLARQSPAGTASEVVDADTGASVLRLETRPGSLAVGGTPSVCRSRPVLVDVASGDVREIGLKGTIDDLFPEPGGTHAWAFRREGGTFTLSA